MLPHNLVDSLWLKAQSVMMLLQMELAHLNESVKSDCDLLKYCFIEKL
jgi:hypothetical protein